ncbi:uncharacterized protein LOC144444272 [Glandiceps talaboti]
MAAGGKSRTNRVSSKKNNTISEENVTRRSDFIIPLIACSFGVFYFVFKYIGISWIKADENSSQDTFSVVELYERTVQYWESLMAIIFIPIQDTVVTGYWTRAKCIVLTLLLMIGLLSLILWCSVKRTKTTITRISDKRINEKKTRKSTTPDSNHSDVYRTFKIGTYVVVIAAVVSIPWEWISMYQNEVAKKAAILYEDIPAECTPQQMSIWQSIKYWLSWHFIWGHDPCYQYHHALLVDPLWEVTPIMAVSSAFTRCIIKPLEIISGGLGQSLQRLFSSIPLAWQPVVMVAGIILLIMVLIMSCNYRISIPFLMSLEPKCNTAKKSCDNRCSSNISGTSSPRRKRPAVTNGCT